MATIKSYSDLQQSRKLAEILPLESADMFWRYNPNIHTYDTIPKILIVNNWDDDYNKNIPCWSLAALLSVLPKIINNETLFIETSPALWHIGYRNIYTARADNLVDSCVAMIEKLNELKML